MKILLTGGTGFIGHHLRQRLKDEGHTVWMVVRSTKEVPSLKKAGLKPFVFDGSTESLVDFMTKEKFDGAIHLASLFLASHQAKDIEPLINSNVLFGTQLLEAVTQSKTSWLVNTGTFWQHYQNELYSPVNLYAATKQAFEDVARYYWESTDLRFVTLKLSDTFGPDDPRPKVMNLFWKIAQSGETLNMSPGDQTLDISFIDDVIDAYLQLIKLISGPGGQKLTGQSFGVQAERRLTLRELSKVFEEVTNTKLHINWGGLPHRPRQVMVPWEKSRKIPGWHQKVSLEEGIKRTFHG